MQHSKPHRIWTVAEAQARLSEILRLAETEGPQYIGSDPTLVLTLMPAEPPDRTERLPLGKWLVQNTPRGLYFETPRDRGSHRPIPYAEYDYDADTGTSDPQR